MIAVVTGATGFLGAPLTRALREGGHDVRTIARGPAPEEHLAADIRELARVEEVLDGADTVFHLAWTSLPQTSNEDPGADVDANLTPGVALLRACVRTGVKKVVFPSSGGTVYGPSSAGLIEETAPTNPISSYGITKLAFEKYLSLYRRMDGLDFRVLRISNAYGEGQPADRPQGLIGVALQRIASGQPLTVWGDGSAVRDYVHVEDVVRAMVCALQPLDADAPRLFNIASGQGHSVTEVLGLIEAELGRTASVTHEPMRSCDASHVVLSPERARQVIGWSPSVPLEAGIGRTVSGVRDTVAT